MLTPVEIDNNSVQINAGIDRNMRDARDSKDQFTTILDKLIKYPTQFGEYLTASNYQEPFADIDEELTKIKRDKQVVVYTEFQAKIQSIVDFLATVEL